MSGNKRILFFGNNKDNACCREKAKIVTSRAGIMPDQTVTFKNRRKRYLFTQVKIEEIQRALR
ncbi:hypothetical protein [Paenibacillus sp. FSL R10-2788]|uniref:hypothetical protein n=1 Tax=Paenibacillus sp. FSL R10-2788 TaxID=2954694 RepID=UPI0030F79898